MSRQSENSKAGSEGNGDSLLSSYQNSPRKTPEFGSAGPFGDHCTDNKSQNCFIFMMNSDSSPENEDQQVNDLKTEYLERLNLIRQKLADIDIANYGSYYNNCYGNYSPRCQITEIFDESPTDTGNSNTENILTRTKPVSVIQKDNEAIVSRDKDEITQDLENENGSRKEERRNQTNKTNTEKNNKLTRDYIDNRTESYYEDFNFPRELRDTSIIEKKLSAGDPNIEDASCGKNPIHDSSNLNTVDQTLALEHNNTNDSSSTSCRTENNQKNVLRITTKATDLLCEDLSTSQDLKNINTETHILNVENLRNNENLSGSCNFKSIDTVEKVLHVVDDENIEDYMTECDANTNTVRNKFELKTIFKFDSPYDVDSAVELIDLNYNPPKKKYCIREKTPKIIMSDGAMSLPYHIRVSLHSEALQTKTQEPIEIDEENIAEKVKINLEEKIQVEDNILIEEKNKHIFPEVQVDCFGGGDRDKIANRSSGILHKFINTQAFIDNPRQSAEVDNEYKVFYFETLEQSPLESDRSHQTIVTETTISDSPPRKPKRRRLLLRSAQNKVKPLDNISLWEEIRTTEAMNKQKQESSSSLESYFKDVIIYKDKTETEIFPPDVLSGESLDVSPTTTPPSRFPSITKITKFCSSIFRKKSVTFAENNMEENGQPNEDLEQSKKDKLNKKKVRENTPKAAHMLLNVRKGQDLDVEIDQITLTDENYSESLETDDEDDSYYEGFCPICFCF